MDAESQIKTERTDGTQNSGNVDLMQTQYVKVATQEVALLIQTVYGYKIEREKLIAKCKSMEEIISHKSQPQQQSQIVSGLGKICDNPGITAASHGNTTPADPQKTTSEKKVPDVQEPEQANLAPEQKFVHQKQLSAHSLPSLQYENPLSSDFLMSRGGSSDELSNAELEEDCAVEEPTAVDLRRGFRSEPDLARNQFAYDAASIKRTLHDGRENTYEFHVDVLNSFSSLTSSSSMNNEPVRHPSISEDLSDSSNVFQIGVAQHYFDCAIEELEKVKKENSFYKRTVTNLEQQLDQLKSKVQELQTIVDKQRQFDQSHPYDSSQELFSFLSKKLNQQDKRLQLNNMAIAQLNKQCESWREKYRESDAENQNLSKRIASLLDEEKEFVSYGVQTDASRNGDSPLVVPHFEMLNSEASHDTKLFPETTYYGLENTTFLLSKRDNSSANEACNGELSNCNADCYNQQYKAVQNENMDLKWKLNKNTERLTRLNQGLFEGCKVLNAMEDPSLHFSTSKELIGFTSLHCPNLDSRDSTLQKIISLICNQNSNNMAGAMSDLFFDEKEQKNSNENARRYNSDTTAYNINNSWATNSL